MLYSGKVLTFNIVKCVSALLLCLKSFTCINVLFIFKSLISLEFLIVYYVGRMSGFSLYE